MDAQSDLKLWCSTEKEIRNFLRQVHKTNLHIKPLPTNGAPQMRVNEDDTTNVFNQSQCFTFLRCHTEIDQ